MYRVLDIANYIVNKCSEDDHLITNIQLQKILGKIQQERDNFIADSAEDWAWGKCFPNVYYKYCGSGAMPINPVVIHSGYTIAEEDTKFIDSIILETKDLEPWEW